MFHSDRITSVHLDVTDKCNASCPMCPRTVNGGPANPYLKNQEMTLEDAKQIFNTDFLKQLNFIQLCGNFGDPMIAKEVLEILQYFREINPSISLGFHTNASGRTPEWWQKLGEILSQPGDYCKFGIDGLEDTNGIYRRNTRWNKIMSAAENFIEAGGIAHWEFLVFRHNEHQIEEAREKAEAMGFQSFFVKKTSRFFDYKTGENKPFAIFDKKGETVDYLYPPQNENLINPVSTFVEKSLKTAVQASSNNDDLVVADIDHESSKEQIQEVPVKATDEVSTENVATKLLQKTNMLGQKMLKRTQDAVEKSKTLTQKFQSLDEYFAKTKISCISLKDSSIYIGNRGEIYPCCFLGGQIAYPDRGPDGDKLEQLAIEKAGSLSAINAKNNSIQNIIDGVWFGAISDMWKPGCPSESKVETCSRMCGNHIELVSGEYA